MLSLPPLHPQPQHHVHLFILETQRVTGDENSSLLSQRKPKMSGCNGMFPVFALREIMVPFNQMPVSRCDLAMPSRATVVWKDQTKDGNRLCDTLIDLRSKARRLLSCKTVNYQLFRQWNVTKQMQICLTNHGFNLQFKIRFSTFNTPRMH